MPRRRDSRPHVVLIAPGPVVLRRVGIPTADVLVLAGLVLLAAPLWYLAVTRLDGPEPAPAAPEASPGATTAESSVPAPANAPRSS